MWMVCGIIFLVFYFVIIAMTDWNPWALVAVMIGSNLLGLIEGQFS